MIFSLLYIVLAALGLGFLVFIHELGHYLIARKEGMTIEIFSIGFGKPFYSWEFQGVKWQLCYLLFGGYVRIAGMEKKGALEPSEIPDGFYGKKPEARIKVALAGPIVNILFAFLAFSLLYVAGGRLKPFSEYTHLIGWVDPSSALYQAEIRPGDKIQSLNHKPFRQFQDLLYAAVLEDRAPEISGEQVDYFLGKTHPFSFQFPITKDEKTADRVMTVSRSLGPASYLLYNRYPDGKENPLSKNSPMQNSGIEYGDRILWVDGELVFSRDQLVSVVNQSKVLLTIKRADRSFLVRVPRLKISDLRINAGQKAELADWHHEAQLSGHFLEQFFIPYNITPQCVVEGPLTYLNDETFEQQPIDVARSDLETPLIPGDQIVAIDGFAVESSYQFLKKIQTRSVQIIVKKAAAQPPVSYGQADTAYLADIDWKALNQMVHSIGTARPIKVLGNLKALNPVTPTPKNVFPYPEEIKARIAKNYEEQKKAVEKIEDSERRAQMQRLVEEANNQLMLGIVPIDAQVIFNPTPIALFSNVFKETYRTLFALFSGNVSPKYMQGPVGIVQVMHHSWSIGFKEALFWLGMISLNLGVLNLLPIPVLDGGHICFSLWETITKKPIKSQTMEKMIIPFVVLLVSLFIYLTYNDLSRLWSRFF